MKVIIDGYGGDNAPLEVVKGCVKALAEDSSLEVAVSGKQDELLRLFDEYKAPMERVTVLDAQEVITNDDVPTQAIKTKTNSSLVVALDALKHDPSIDGLVSAGSTGAVLAGAFLKLGRVRKISRPALAPILPTITGGHAILVDCGANLDCSAKNLCHFALMGVAYMQAVFGIERPRVGLLCNGVEEHKGTVAIREAYATLKQMDINFIGNVEARELTGGDVDVLVSDGFHGNICLKSAEGMAKNVLKLMKDTIYAGGLRAKLGALMLKPVFKQLKSTLDYSEHGGAALLGVTRPIIKSHGSSKATSFAASIHQVANMARGKIVDRLKNDLEKMVDVSESD